jgi:hypothetical protein
VRLSVVFVIVSSLLSFTLTSAPTGGRVNVLIRTC